MGSIFKFSQILSQKLHVFSIFFYMTTTDSISKEMSRNSQFGYFGPSLVTMIMYGRIPFSYGLTDTVAATAAVRADIPGTPGESDGFRLICCTCETEIITGPELGQTLFGFCLPKPGNRPTGKNSVVWDSPSLGWWETVKELIAAAGSVCCEDSSKEHSYSDYCRRQNRLSSDSVLLLGYHMGGA